MKALDVVLALVTLAIFAVVLVLQFGEITAYVGGFSNL